MLQTRTNKISFTKNLGFRKELNKRVEAYFESAGISTRDNPAMYFKTAVISTWVIAAWIFTVFGPPMLWLKVLGCIVLAAGIAAVGFSISHDANHGGYSRKKWVNSLFGFFHDVVGVSSYLWRFRHNYLHHTYTNILGHDVEIHGDGLVRMSPHTEHRWHHSFQHILVYFLYAIVPLYWCFADVNLMFFNPQYHDHKIPKRTWTENLLFVLGKGLWLLFFVGIPLVVGYTPLQVLSGVLITYLTHGLISCSIFMLAHVLEPAEFIQPDPDSHAIEDEWAIFQIRTTVDFAPKNAFLNWYIGGLNYQVVHHLFPQICHIHYPQIAPILAEVCEEFGVHYAVYPTFTEAMVANYRWMKQMAIAPAQ